jgi:Zn-dependent peptidase ImmA (M78 family)
VLTDRFRTTRIQAVSVKQEPAAAIVLLNQANAGYRNPLRRRVDLAHELAHILFDEPNGSINVTVDSSTDVNRAPTEAGHPPNEQRANAFAAELLIPLHGLRRLLGPPPPKGNVSYADAFAVVQRVREEFKTPKEVAVNHLCWRGYVDQCLHGTLIRAAYPRIGPAPERYARRSVIERRVILARRRGLITSMRARELLGLSVWDELPDEIGD